MAIAILLHVLCGCFGVIAAKLSNCDRDCDFQSLKYSLCDPLQRKFVNPCFVSCPNPMQKC